MELIVRSILAGICFGIWPLCMNRSGLFGNVSSAVFGLGVFLGVAPFAIYTGLSNVTQANWYFVTGAVITGAAGVLFFNGMLAKATAQNVGILFVTMIVVQIMIPAFQNVWVNGLTISKLLGFVAAIVAAILLSR